jgi:hypothetical protein
LVFPLLVFPPVELDALSVELLPAVSLLVEPQADSVAPPVEPQAGSVAPLAEPQVDSVSPLVEPLADSVVLPVLLVAPIE